MTDKQEPERLTPSGEHRNCYHEDCPRNPEVVTTPRLMATISAALEHVVSWKTLLYMFGGCVTALLTAAVLWGGFVYAQSKDAGMAASRDAAAVASEALAKVNALTLVVAQNERLRKDDAKEQAADIKALSAQLRTGVQPERLKPDKDGGPP